jgi:hypothetical protein
MQGLHAVNASASLYVPALQLSQKVDPAIELKVEDGHFKQSVKLII